ncbi:MAG: mechanosensitive ion channel [Thermoplasmata archaeon]|nr:mechanosensitive ion channel [Thermoplasmata archaeon]
MNARRAAAVVAIVALAAMLIPLASSASEALDTGDVSISTVDGNDIVVDLDSGESTTVSIYVINNSEKYLAVKASVSDITDMDESLSVSSSLMYPASSGESTVSVITLTLEADSYADTGVDTGTVTIVVTNMADATDTGTYTVSVTANITSVYMSGDSYNKFFGIFPNTLGSPFDSKWFTAGVTLVLWLIATAVVSELIIPLFTRLVGDRSTKQEKKSLADHVTVTITGIMFIIAINECTQIVGADAEVSHFVESWSFVFYVILGAVMAWQIYLFVITAFLKGLDEKADIDGMDMSLLPLFKMLGKLVITVVAVCAALAAFGVDLAGIMVSAGVVTLGITFGAQEMLNQFFSGIVMLATRPFKKGDFVQINGTTYIVRKVRLMYTEFDSWDKDQVITMPNNVVSAATVVNFTRDSPNTRVFIYIDVAYDSDIPKVKAALERAGRKHPHVITDGSVSPPGARLTEFGDSGIVFRLACYVDDYDNSSHYAGQIRELVIQELTDEGIEVPYNRIEVDILKEPTGNRDGPKSSSRTEA